MPYPKMLAEMWNGYAEKMEQAHSTMDPEKLRRLQEFQRLAYFSGAAAMLKLMNQIARYPQGAQLLASLKHELEDFEEECRIKGGIPK